MKPEPIKLTRAQIDAILKATPARPGEPNMALLGIPIIEVETVEESTPHQLATERLLGDLDNWKPRGILGQLP